MDSFFKSMNQKSRAKSNCITFFPFLPKTTSPWPKKLLHLVNQEIAKFALKNPDVDIFIKPKSRDLDKSNWKNIFDESLQEIAVNQKEINNLKISSKFNTYDLLKKSKYIIALNSSVILEAAILGKPVIIPYFDIIKNNKYKDSIYFRESLKCFDTPKDSEQLRKFLTKRLKNSFINKRILTQRKNLFKKIFSLLRTKYIR